MDVGFQTQGTILPSVQRGKNMLKAIKSHFRKNVSFSYAKDRISKFKWGGQLPWNWHFFWNTKSFINKRLASELLKNFNNVSAFKN